MTTQRFSDELFALAIDPSNERQLSLLNLREDLKKDGLEDLPKDQTTLLEQILTDLINQIPLAPKSPAKTPSEVLNKALDEDEDIDLDAMMKELDELDFNIEELEI